MTIKLREHAAAAVLSVVTAGVVPHALAEANTYGIFDGSKYKPEQLALAARSPIMMEAPRFEKNAYYVPRSPDGHYYVSGTLNNFPVVFLVDTGPPIPRSRSSSRRIRDCGRAGRLALPRPMGSLLHGLASRTS